MNLSDPLGPGAHARRDVCRPGEPLLWAARGRVLYYDVAGLDPVGAPRKSGLVRGLGAVGRGAADVVGYAITDLLSDNFDQSADRPPPPDVLAFGGQPDCLAHRRLRGLEPVGGPSRLWALTPHRLVVTGPRPVPPPAQEPTGEKKQRSLLGKAARFGADVVTFGRDVARIVSDTTQSYGDNVEGVPVTAPEIVAETEIPRSEIVGFALAERRAKVRSMPCLRLSLADGSGIDFLVGRADRATYERMLALTHGAA